MHIQDSIITTLPVFKLGDPLKKVIQFFKSATYSHIAVMDGEVFVGVLEKNDLDNFEADKRVEEYRYQLATFFVRKDTSWLDVLETFSKNEAISEEHTSELQSRE